MAKEPKYTKDTYTGAVIFQDVDAYAKRKKVIEENRLEMMAKKDSRRVINSMKNELNGLKKIVYDLVESGK